MVLCRNARAERLRTPRCAQIAPIEVGHLSHTALEPRMLCQMFFNDTCQNEPSQQSRRMLAVDMQFSRLSAPRRGSRTASWKYKYWSVCGWWLILVGRTVADWQSQIAVCDRSNGAHVEGSPISCNRAVSTASVKSNPSPTHRSHDVAAPSCDGHWNGTGAAATEQVLGWGVQPPSREQEQGAVPPKTL